MLIGSYSFTLVFISLCVAILASYTALDLTGRIATAKGRAVHFWTAGGALAMGVGVWSMHFIGMLAFKLPIDLGYDFALTALSLLIAVLSCGFALWLVSQPKLPLAQLAFGALIMGSGISAMHYTGMAALRMTPGIELRPDPVQCLPADRRRRLSSGIVDCLSPASAIALCAADSCRRGGDHGCGDCRHALHRHGCCAIS